MQKELYANAQSVPCDLGGRRYGHLGVIMPDANYQTLDDLEEWEDPDHPGAYPNIAAGTETASITNQIKRHENNLRLYKTFLQVDSGLMHMLLNAVDTQYLTPLEDTMLGFAKVSTCEALEHLRTTYG